MNQLLKGQKALVTGASSGIGKAVAMALGRAGAGVVINYRGGDDAANQVIMGKIVCIRSVHAVIPWAGPVNDAVSKGRSDAHDEEHRPAGRRPYPHQPPVRGDSRSYHDLMRLVP